MSYVTWNQQLDLLLWSGVQWRPSLTNQIYVLIGIRHTRFESPNFEFAYTDVDQIQYIAFLLLAFIAVISSVLAESTFFVDYFSVMQDN